MAKQIRFHRDDIPHVIGLLEKSSTYIDHDVLLTIVTAHLKWGEIDENLFQTIFEITAKLINQGGNIPEAAEEVIVLLNYFNKEPMVEGVDFARIRRQTIAFLIHTAARKSTQWIALLLASENFVKEIISLVKSSDQAAIGFFEKHLDKVTWDIRNELTAWLVVNLSEESVDAHVSLLVRLMKEAGKDTAFMILQGQKFGTILNAVTNEDLSKTKRLLFFLLTQCLLDTFKASSELQDNQVKQILLIRRQFAQSNTSSLTKLSQEFTS